MNNSLISIIVPIYKAQQTIHRCIDSLLAQTYPDFELILIDDGSPDQCGLICDEYAAKDERIVVVHQQNRGVATALHVSAGLICCVEHTSFIVIRMIGLNRKCLNSYGRKHKR